MREVIIACEHRSPWTFYAPRNLVGAHGGLALQPPVLRLRVRGVLAAMAMAEADIQGDVYQLIAILDPAGSLAILRGCRPASSAAKKPISA